MIKLPRVIFNDGVLEIKGNLIPMTQDDDLNSFLKDVMNIFEKNDIHLVILDFEYVNSAGIKELCQLVKNIVQYEVSISWFYEEKDENLFEIIKLCERKFSKTFSKIPKK